MLELQTISVEHEARHIVIRQAVELVTRDGMSDVLQVHAELMGATSLWLKPA